MESRCRRLICQIPPANDYYYYNADADDNGDEHENDENQSGPPSPLFLLEPKKSSVVSSMGLLIARAVGQAPAIKVASKGFFSIATKMASKAADGDKKT